MPDQHAQPEPGTNGSAGIQAAGTARVHILQDGYAREDDAGERVGSTVTLIVDGDVIVVVDPGMVSSRAGLLAALAEHAVAPESVTDVVFSHHHPDHTVNAALFPAARIHDFWAVYDGDLWISRDAEGTELSPSIRLIATPGHTDQDISTVASTAGGVYVCTHAWWGAAGPAVDPFSPDQVVLSQSRARIHRHRDRGHTRARAELRPGPRDPALTGRWRRPRGGAARPRSLYGPEACMGVTPTTGSRNGCHTDTRRRRAWTAVSDGLRPHRPAANMICAICRTD